MLASSGRYTRLDGGHARVPFGFSKIGRVAAGEEPGFVTNDVIHDPRVQDHDWARELGLVSFAGYPLVSHEGEPIGVLALFSRKALSEKEESLLQAIAATTSEVILVSRSLDALRESEEKYRTVFENMVQGAYYQRHDGVLLDCNPAFLELVGITRDEFMGKTLTDANWRAIREDGSEFPLEKRPSVDALRTGKPVRNVTAGLFNARARPEVALRGLEAGGGQTVVNTAENLFQIFKRSGRRLSGTGSRTRWCRRPLVDYDPAGGP